MRPDIEYLTAIAYNVLAIAILVQKVDVQNVNKGIDYLIPVA